MYRVASAQQHAFLDGHYLAGMVYKLAYLLEYEPGTGHLISNEYQDAGLYARFAEHLLKWVDALSYEASVLYERTGRYYETIGDLIKTLALYKGLSEAAEKLLKSDPNNQIYRNLLPISCEKLGNTYTAKGDLDKALELYKQYAGLREQLHQDHPQHTDFKNGLAVSLAKLGQFYQKQDNGKILF